MVKKVENKVVKMKLDKLLRIKDEVEARIKRNEFLMRKNNSRPTTEEVQIDFPLVKTEYELLLDQLILVKEAIGFGNALVDSKGVSNSKNIYCLSNLNRRKAFLNSLNTFEGRRTTMKSAGKEIEFSANLKYKDINVELGKIEAEIRELEDKLSEFNHNTDTSVIIYDSLALN
jgi:hypothetical protein